tara:strand:- start:398 stop:724 length:327 start_codon:yes stop_codon:yes gene_type:complete
MLFICSCSKQEINEPLNFGNLITTSGLNFVPEVLNCNVGDTIFFELGNTHNAIEVSEENYNANNSTPLENGFELGFGESNYIVVVEAKTHFYVCTPHLPGMKARIIVY